MSERTYVSDKVLCRLCTCEGVKGTLLCKEHLEGFEYACKLLNDAPAQQHYKRIAETLHRVIEQAWPAAPAEQAKEQPIEAVASDGTVTARYLHNGHKQQPEK